MPDKNGKASEAEIEGYRRAYESGLRERLMEAGRELDAVRQERDALLHQVAAVVEETDLPLWRRIGFQRKQLSDLQTRFIFWRDYSARVFKREYELQKKLGERDAYITELENTLEEWDGDV